MEEQSELGVNVVEAWHKSLFISLMKIQEYERVARDGASSIEQIFQINRNDIPYIQYQYLRMIITEMDMLLSNTREIISKEFYDNASKEIKNAEEIFDKHSGFILGKKYDNINKIQVYYLTNLYFKVQLKIKEIREQLVLELSPILYGSKEGVKKTW